MATTIAVRQEIVEAFRSEALEQLQRIEASWVSLLEHPEDTTLAQQLDREVHTLKGNSRGVGFVDVGLLCHKLEELFAIARKRRYKIPEDLDLLVGMAVRFIVMLVRKKAGQSLGGIDLAGFLKQIDDTVRSCQEVPADPAAPLLPHTPAQKESHTDRITPEIRAKTAVALTAVYLESAHCPPEARTRLRQAWTDLCAFHAAPEPVPFSQRLARHLASLPALARELGKDVAIDADPGTIVLPPQIAEAVDVVLLHTLRNAVDHGIEAPDPRRKAGKAAQGRLSIRAAARDADLEVVVEDDGAGVNFDAVRRKAVATGLLKEGQDVVEKDLVDLLFRPGFSTRGSVTDISGRGVGLDAARAALSRFGGSVALETRAGRGTTIRLLLPNLNPHLWVHRFQSADRSLVLTIAESWRMRPATAEDAGVPDLLAASGFDAGRSDAPASRVLLERFGARWILRVSEVLIPARASRTLPTPASSAFEVVLVGDQEALLLRPEAVRPRL